MAGMKSMNKSYEELMSIESFEKRYEYLQLSGVVGEETFGANRYLNQSIYTSSKWKDLRRKAIIRDNGCDLGHSDRQLNTHIVLHHINPLTLEDIETNSPKIYDLDNLICTSLETHNAIHFGDDRLILKNFEERKRGDTTLW